MNPHQSTNVQARTPLSARNLKSISHTLDPSVRIGKSGVSAGVLEEIRKNLKKHHIIKIKILKNAGLDKPAVTAELEEKIPGHVVSFVGSVVTVAEKSDDE